MTAEEFLEKWCLAKGYTSIDECDDIEKCMIEFAKYHVEAALKAVDNNAEVLVIDYDEGFDRIPTPIYGVDSNSILKAYPLENIK